MIADSPIYLSRWKLAKLTQQGEEQGQSIGRGFGVLNVEYVAAAKSDAMYLMRQIANEFNLVEDGALIVVLTTTGRSSGCVPVGAVHKVHLIVM